MVYYTIFYIILTYYFVVGIHCNSHIGPDPWNYEENDGTHVEDDKNIPPDLRIYPKKNSEKIENSYGIGEWFYKRLLSIVIKGGEVKNEDGMVDISIQMKLDQDQWHTLNNYVQSSIPLTEEKLRRSLGYIEQSIYEPSVPIKIVLEWSEYIQLYITEYKSAITWCCALLAFMGLGYWMWTHMSHRQAVILMLVIFYAYEVVVSYKEVEQKEVENFMAALKQCKGYFWSTECDVPKPDPLIFLKHMNPLKIGVRMFTTIVSEPMIALSSTVKIMTDGITAGLWSPFDKIFYGILITFFNVLLLFFLIMIVFNFILNIPFSLSVFGLVSVGLLQRNRNVFGEANNQNHAPTPPPRVENANNVIDNNVIHRLLDMVAQGLNNRQNNQVQNAVEFRAAQNRQNEVQNAGQFRDRNVPLPVTNVAPTPGLRRSASTGRLPDYKEYENVNQGNVRRRHVLFNIDAGGDAR